MKVIPKFQGWAWVLEEEGGRNTNLTAELFWLCTFQVDHSHFSKYSGNSNLHFLPGLIVPSTFYFPKVGSCFKKELSWPQALGLTWFSCCLLNNQPFTLEGHEVLLDPFHIQGHGNWDCVLQAQAHLTRHLWARFRDSGCSLGDIATMTQMALSLKWELKALSSTPQFYYMPVGLALLHYFYL